MMFRLFCNIVVCADAYSCLSHADVDKEGRSQGCLTILDQSDDWRLIGTQASSEGFPTLFLFGVVPPGSAHIESKSCMSPRACACACSISTGARSNDAVA